MKKLKMWAAWDLEKRCLCVRNFRDSLTVVPWARHPYFEVIVTKINRPKKRKK